MRISYFSLTGSIKTFPLGGRWRAALDEGIKNIGIPLISQKSEIFASFPQWGKLLRLCRELPDKPQFT